ncbi:hypothetical protein KDA23_05945 [Candidatus Saccharibacteria bacterium]|nr:hypothetical protein [Candidatus Saccharibacteria bacterium]
MSRELRHSANPWRMRIIWAISFVVLVVLLLFAFYRVFDRIQTYSLPNGSVELSVPYSKYLVGETITFTVKNNFNSSIQVSNGCPGEPLSVFRYEKHKWVQIHDKTNIKNCADQERTVTIPANQSMTASFKNWPHLFNKAGKYRIVMRVDFYNSLPYQDFEVINKPKAYAAVHSGSGQPSTSTKSSTSTQQNGVSEHEDANEGGSATQNKVYTLYVNSSGNYNLTSISMHVGDTLKIVYQSPYHDEVRTRFTPINGTSASVSSVTVDEERHSGTRIFTSAGTWRYKADDHSGNSGVVTVSK